jgi:predicted phosphohydrolase
MTIWAIADLHASRPDPDTGRPSKPMDVFGPRWVGHMDKLEAVWQNLINPNDTVVIAGDIDWALHLTDALFTLERLHAWNGTKILVRGNHDYWWSSKTTSRVRRILPPSIRLLHNDSMVAEGVNICGCKGSPVPGGIEWTPDKEKLLQREVHRLRFSLESRVRRIETIAAIHYPPFYPNVDSSPYKDVLEQSQVHCCVYGHLHGEAANSGPKGIIDGIQYALVAGDYVNFEPVPIWHGAFVASQPNLSDTWGTAR